MNAIAHDAISRLAIAHDAISRLAVALECADRLATKIDSLLDDIDPDAEDYPDVLAALLRYRVAAIEAAGQQRLPLPAPLED